MMKPLNISKPRLWIGLGLTMSVAALYAASASFVRGDDANPAVKAKNKVEKTKLTGMELYAIHCNRCHPERYATEWTPAQWNTIMLHMRVRANLPAKQAKEILKYLKEDAGN